MADTHICTHCGYEGRPIRRPGEGDSEDDESILITGLNKIFFAVTMIPLKFGWIVRLAKRGKAKECPNCGLPLMVKLSSDAGFVAKRKQEVKAGVRFDRPAPPPVVFGKEVILPGDEVKPEVPQAPKLEKLPTLEEMMAPPPEHIATQPQPQPITPAPKPVKKTDPDVW